MTSGLVASLSINGLIESWGYFAVALLVGLESFGVPLPGETTLVAAAVYAGHTGKLNVWGIFAVAAAAAIVGDSAGYWIGDKGGYRLLVRYGNLVRFDEPKVKVARYLFERHGGKVVFFGRFVSVLRTYAAFLAGTTRMHYAKSFAFNASGGILWAAAYTFAAYFAGATLAKVSTPLTIAFVALAVLAIVAGVVLARRRYASILPKALAAYPEPLES